MAIVGGILVKTGTRTWEKTMEACSVPRIALQCLAVSTDASSMFAVFEGTYIYG